jgi:hypothetical protein
LALGKNENSIWEQVQDDSVLVDKELLEKMFKMNPGMKRAETMMKKFVDSWLSTFSLCCPNARS